MLNRINRIDNSMACDSVNELMTDDQFRLTGTGGKVDDFVADAHVCIFVSLLPESSS